MKGEIINWLPLKHYGFIERTDRVIGGKIFFHGSAFQEGENPRVGMRVYFEEGRNPYDNRLCAINVRPIEDDDE